MTETKETHIGIMNTDVAKLRAILANIGKVAGTDRMPLVRIEQVDNGVRFTATDSYCLVQATMTQTEDGTVQIVEPFSVDAKQLMKAAKIIGKRCEYVSMNLTGNMFSVTTTDGTVNVDCIVQPWPSVENILVDAAQREFPTRESKEQLWINPEILSNMLDVMGKITGEPHCGVQLVAAGFDPETGTGKKAWLFEGPSSSPVSVVGAIMPIRK